MPSPLALWCSSFLSVLGVSWFLVSSSCCWPFASLTDLFPAAFNTSRSTSRPSLLLAPDRGPIGNIDPSPSLNAPKEMASESSPVLEITPVQPPKRKPSHVPSHPSSLRSAGSVDTGMIGSVEDAVVLTAVRSLPSPQTPLFPHSAPARFGDTAPSRSKRHILPSQSLFVEELEQEQPPETGPRVRRPAAHTPMTIVVHHDESDESASPGEPTPGSAVFGSDIVQITPGLRRADARASIADPRESIIYSPRDSMSAPHSGHRDSTTSTQYVVSPSEYSPEERRFSALSRRISTGRTSFLGRDALKSPWRSISRYSFASARTKSREELPTLPEGEASDAASASHRTTRSRKRTTFGQISSKRAGKEPAYLTSPREPDETVPPLPTSPLPPLILSPGRIRALPVPPMIIAPQVEDPTSQLTSFSGPSHPGPFMRVSPTELSPIESPVFWAELPAPESPTRRERSGGLGQVRGPRPRHVTSPDPSLTNPAEPGPSDPGPSE